MSTARGFSHPIHVTTWMAAFLAVVCLVAALLAGQLEQAFRANVAFNTLILAVLGVGILVNFRQVWRLEREVRFIEAFQLEANRRPAVMRTALLAPMAQLLEGRGSGRTSSLSPMSARSILDGIQIRLEESRDLSRYLIGLLIFLGLLGTFWGLLVTIRSVGEIIAGMSAGTDALAMFDTLKQRLEQPLSGMATSFSTSLFGLAGSLVLGFLDLQASHAANRFYNEIEDWLSTRTQLPAGAIGGEGEGSVPAYVQALLEQTAESLDKLQRVIAEGERERKQGAQQMGELNQQLARLAERAGRESREIEEMVATQEDLRALLRLLAAQPAGGGSAEVVEEMRRELRLMTRTLAAALDSRSR